MAKLPVNNTGVRFVDYANAIATHTFAVRFIAPIDETSFTNDVEAVLLRLNDIVGASTVLGVRQRNQDSNVSFPVASGLVGYNFGTGAVDVDHNPIALTFVGRTINGVRARLSIFGYKGSTSAYRLTSAEFDGIQNAVAALNLAEDIFMAIDQEKPIWYPYADVKPNDYWVRRARG